MNETTKPETDNDNEGPDDAKIFKRILTTLGSLPKADRERLVRSVATFYGITLP